MACLTDGQIKRCFDLFDADSSGAIDAQELANVMTGLGFEEMDDDAIATLLQEVDKDNSGVIEFDEFKDMCINRMTKPDTPEGMQASFQAFDEGAKGTVTVADMLRVAAAQKSLRIAEESDLERLFFDLVQVARMEQEMDRSDPAAVGVSFEQWQELFKAPLPPASDPSEGEPCPAMDDSAYDIKTRSRITKLGSIKARVEAGKTYYYCTCGYSKNQPFCDGSHVAVNKEQGSSFRPMAYQATEDGIKSFCGCRRSNKLPLCDGSHRQVNPFSENESVQSVSVLDTCMQYLNATPQTIASLRCVSWAWAKRAEVALPKFTEVCPKGCCVLIHPAPTTELSVAGMSNVTDAAAASLALHTGVVDLNVSGTAITNDGLATIAGAMKKLERLNVSGTAVTDDGLMALAQCAALTEISADESAVTEDGRNAVFAAIAAAAEAKKEAEVNNEGTSEEQPAEEKKTEQPAEEKKTEQPAEETKEEEKKTEQPAEEKKEEEKAEQPQDPEGGEQEANAEPQQPVEEKTE